MEKETVQNGEATVSNAETVETVKDVVVETTMKQMFRKLVLIDNIENLTEDIIERVVKDLRDKSFMTVNLELTDEQIEKMMESFPMVVRNAKEDYIKDMNKDSRLDDIVKSVKKKMKGLINYTLASISAEINRGALINATAVSASAKGKTNKIELSYEKDAGDITVPTDGLFISTNCVSSVIDSIENTDLKNDDPANDEECIDPETGEVLEE